MANWWDTQWPVCEPYGLPGYGALTYTPPLYDGAPVFRVDGFEFPPSINHGILYSYSNIVEGSPDPLYREAWGALGCPACEIVGGPTKEVGVSGLVDTSRQVWFGSVWFLADIASLPVQLMGPANGVATDGYTIGVSSAGELSMFNGDTTEGGVVAGPTIPTGTTLLIGVECNVIDSQYRIYVNGTIYDTGIVGPLTDGMIPAFVNYLSGRWGLHWAGVTSSQQFDAIAAEMTAWMPLATLDSFITQEDGFRLLQEDGFGLYI